MKQTIHNTGEPLRLSMQYFADTGDTGEGTGAEGGTEPTSTATGDTGTGTTSTHAGDTGTGTNTELESLRAQLAEAQTARASAEQAVVDSKRTIKELERKGLTEEEALAQRQKDLDEREKDLHKRMNQAVARNILADLNLTDKEMTADELDLFVSADEERTTARCEWLKRYVNAQVEKTEKAVREAVLKETPKPPSGGAVSEPQSEIEKRIAKYK